MPKKSITETRREKDAAAIRSARYREQHRDRPDVRAVDKAISEALAIYARTLSPVESTRLLGAIVELATTGLVYQSYGARSAKSRTAARLRSWISGSLSSGGVRAAVDRAAVASASRADPHDTPVTSSYAITRNATEQNSELDF